MRQHHKPKEHNMTDTPATLAAVLRKYAEHRREYLHPEGIPAINDALQVEISAYEKAARLIEAPTDRDNIMGLPSWRWSAWPTEIDTIRATHNI